MTALDVVGPYDVLCRIPQAQVIRVAQKPGLITTSSAGLQLLAEHALEDVQDGDLLFIPGSGRATTLQNSPHTLEWIRKMYDKVTWISSVCTGSLILAKAGLLKGIEATSHWAVLKRLSSLGAVAVNRRIVESGKIVTAAGVTAGIELALMLTAKLAGVQTAKMLQLAIEYDPHPPFDCGSIDRAPPEMVETMQERFEQSFEPF